MRTVTWAFRSNAEAQAFLAGVEWVNDSSIELTDSRDLHSPNYHLYLGTTLTFSDQDGDGNATYNHRESTRTP